MRGGQEVALILAVLSGLSLGFTGCSGQSDTLLATGGGAGTGSGGANASANSGGGGGFAGTAHGGAGGTAGSASGTAGTAGAGGTGGTGGAGGTAGAAGTVSTAGAAGIAGSAGGGGTGMVSAQFKPIVTSFCAAARACCGKASTEVMLDDCESAFYGRQVALASVDEGKVTVDSAALDKCQTAYQQAASACDENALLSACQGVFLGTKEVGEACANSYECDRAQGAMTCLFADNAPVGVCRKVPHGKLGEACLSSCRLGDDCSSQTYGAADSNLTLCFESDGLYCDNFADSGAVCKPIVATGQACGSSDACGTLGVCYTTCQPAGVLHGPCGMGCRHDLTCVSGTCEDPSLAVGGTCLGYPPAP